MKQDGRKKNGGHRNCGRLTVFEMYGEEVKKIELRIPVSAIESVNMVILCYEIKHQLTGLNKLSVENALKEKNFVGIIKMMQENAPENLRESTKRKLLKFLIQNEY